MKRASFGLLALGLVVSPLACNLLDPNQSTILPVTKLDAPATVSAAAPFSVTLTIRTGGCTSFDRLDVQRMDGGARIVPWGNDATIGHKNVSCAAYILETPHTIQLDPPFPNPLYISVEQGRMPPVTATVQVQ